MSSVIQIFRTLTSVELQATIEEGVCLKIWDINPHIPAPKPEKKYVPKEFMDPSELAAQENDDDEEPQIPAPDRLEKLKKNSYFYCHALVPKFNFRVFQCDAAAMVEVDEVRNKLVDFFGQDKLAAVR